MATLVSISIKGYTEAGHEAAFDFTAASDNVQAEMIDAMNQLWLAGVTPNLPGWVQRHDFEVCDTVLLREQENADGSRTPIVTLYTVKPYLNHKFLHEYLNTVDDVRAFEALIGRSLKGIPLYPGTTAPERGKRQQDAQYFVKVHPFGVLKRIPEAGEGEDAREKHRLVRFIPIDGISQSPAIDASKARADLGGGEQPRIMGRSATPAAVRSAADALAGEPTPDASFDEMFPKSGANPFNANIPASNEPPQPTLLKPGDDGTRSAGDIGKLCNDFYAWASKAHPQFSHDDLHSILEVASAKDYFATHSLGDAKTEVMNFAKGVQKVASGQ